MIKNFLDVENEDEASVDPKRKSQHEVLSLFDSGDEQESADETYVLSSAPTESFVETTRRSGLAWSAGIAFFASVAFLLILGWGADLLFGTSPWGIVVGIVLGSLIGFVQLFRLSSQIFKQ